MILIFANLCNSYFNQDNHFLFNSSGLNVSSPPFGLIMVFAKCTIDTVVKSDGDALFLEVACVVEISQPAYRESKNKTGKVACTKCLFSIERKQ